MISRLSCVVAGAAFLYVGHQALEAETLTYDFRSGNILDWKQTLGHAVAAQNNALAAQKGADEPHKSLVLTSPPFTLTSGSALTFTLSGGSSSAFPKSLNDITDASTPVGFMGMGLRRISDDSYLLTASRNRNQNTFGKFEFSKTKLAALIKQNPSEVYVLDFIEAKHGGWGHVELQQVTIPGKETAAVNPPPKGFEKTDYSIYLQTEHGQLKFTQDSFAVKPNSTVKVVLINTDEMQHNFLVSKPGKEMNVKIGTMAIMMGIEGPKKQYVPDSPDVLFATDIVEPGEKKAVYFKAPAKEGDYPYVCTIPGHFMTMTGVMKVRKNAGAKKSQPKPAKPKYPASTIAVTDAPVIQRAELQGSLRKHAGMGAIMVGLPGELNYAFNTERCALAVAWTGGFLNMRREWGGRGGGGGAPAGPAFFSIEQGGGLVSGESSPIFHGYSLKEGHPVFKYAIGEAQVTHTVRIESEGPGIVQTLSVAGDTADLVFATSDSATWTSSDLSPIEGQGFKVPAGKPITFEVRSAP